MSVKVAKVTSATVTPRERRRLVISHETHERTSARKNTKKIVQVFFVYFVGFVVSRVSWLRRSFQQQTAERWNGEAQRVLEAVRRGRLRFDAPLIADVAAAIHRRVAVHLLGVVSRHRHPDAV